MAEELNQLGPFRFPFALKVNAVQGEPEASSKSNSVKTDYFEGPGQFGEVVVLLPA